MNITGAQTAMYRKQASAPARYLHDLGLFSGRVLDFGCGRGDLRFLSIPEVELWEWDPAHQIIPIKQGKEVPEEDLPVDYFDVVYSGYVLNVVPVEKQISIVQNIGRHLKEGGVGYVAVRRDVPTEGTPTQWYVSLPHEIIKKTSGYCIYRIE